MKVKGTNKYKHVYMMHQALTGVVSFDMDGRRGSIEIDYGLNTVKLYEFHRTIVSPYKNKLSEENMEIVNTDDEAISDAHILYPDPLVEGYSLN